MIYRVYADGDFYRTVNLVGVELENEILSCNFGWHYSPDELSKKSVSELAEICSDHGGDPALDSFCFSKAEAVEISKTMKGDDE